ncbi:MAG: hypothetical protein ACQEXJ_12850 [Myxococcota bacterium]
MMLDTATLRASIPADLQAHADAVGCDQAGFRAGPGFMAGLDEAYDPPVPLDTALSWIARYQAAKRAHVRLADRTVLWFESRGFYQVDTSGRTPDSAGVVVRHRE